LYTSPDQVGRFVRPDHEDAVGQASGLKRVEDLEERETVKIGIVGTDPSDAVLAHEDGYVRVVKQVACDVRELGKDLAGDLGVSFRSDEKVQPGGGE
jgi:hypothetical protein